MFASVFYTIRRVGAHKRVLEGESLCIASDAYLAGADLGGRGGGGAEPQKLVLLNSQKMIWDSSRENCTTHIL